MPGLVILPLAVANDFKLFCQKNPRPCPLVEVLAPGEREPKALAPGADIATDLPKYRVYRFGELKEERTDVRDLWRSDFVTFLIGCSFSFEKKLQDGGVPVRNIEQKKNVSMYITNKECEAVGPFRSRLVVTYRPIPSHLVPVAVQITQECGVAHGPPVHIGDPLLLGINDLSKPDFGDPVEAHPGDVPVFWACGVTSTLAALAPKCDIVITHAPGHMFITDKLEFQ
jgi:uncharacterized protein YcsI (UPF0317 family)